MSEKTNGCMIEKNYVCTGNPACKFREVASELRFCERLGEDRACYDVEAWKEAEEQANRKEQK